jgi:hypothetical protein
MISNTIGMLPQSARVSIQTIFATWWFDEFARFCDNKALPSSDSQEDTE